MTHRVGLFVPDDLAGLPAIDPQDTEYQTHLEDQASLASQGGSIGNVPNMQHMNRDVKKKPQPRSSREG